MYTYYIVFSQRVLLTSYSLCSLVSCLSVSLFFGLKEKKWKQGRMKTRSQRKLEDALPPSPQSKDADAQECRAPKRRKRGPPQDPASTGENPSSTIAKRGSAGNPNPTKRTRGEAPNPASAGETPPSPIPSAGEKPNNRKRKRGATGSPNSAQQHTEAKKRKRGAAGNPISADENLDSEKRNEGAAGNPNCSPCRSRKEAQENAGKPENPAIDGETPKDEASICQRRITKARLRWKDLVSRMLEKDTTISPGARKLPKIKKEASQVQRTKSTYKNRRQQIHILKHLTAWLTKAKFRNVSLLSFSFLLLT